MMEVGDLCFVKHHYGHTRVNDQMRILKIENNIQCKSGIAVFVDGLNWCVDAGLIVLKPKNQYKIRFLRTVNHNMESAFIDAYDDYDARVRFKSFFSDYKISSVKLVERRSDVAL